MKGAVHPLVDDYVRALEAAAQSLPRRERDELVSQIRDHIDEALPLEPTEADVRNVLDQLGSPYDIVAAARPDQPSAQPARRGAREAFALILLVTGIPPVIGWLVGVALLLWSPLWSGRQKLLGALVWPGGFFGLLLVLATPVSVSGNHCATAVIHGRGTPGNGFATEHAVSVGTCSSSSVVHPWVWVPIATVAVLAPLLVAAYLWRAAGRRSAA